MQEALEIARFTVKPDAEEQFLAEREQVIAHLRRHFSGLIDARLVKLENGEYLDLVRWASREQALLAAEGAMKVPEIAAWFAHIAEVRGMDHAEVIHVAPAVG